MNTELLIREKRRGYIQLSTLLMWAFASAFFPAVLTLLKFPSTVNLAHFIIVPSICILTLAKTRVQDRRQISITKELFIALFIFFGVTVASGFLNDAGIVNIILDFLFLCEPFLMILAIVSIPLTLQKLVRLRSFLVLAAFINLAFAFIQYYVLHLQLLGGDNDNIKGVFIGQGAGHVVGASVSLSFGVFYILNAKNVPLWIRIPIFLASFWHLILSDAKQVLLVFGIAWILLLLIKLNDIAKALMYATIAIVLGGTFLWCMQNLPEFSAYNTWNRPEIYGSDGEATKLKLATFRIIPTYYTSFLHPWLGLGPGHTVGRLGGWMLAKYQDLLKPLGATIHPASLNVWDAAGKSWLGNQSSMFSPLFGWAGIWGDLGFLGLGSFIYIWSVVWRRICTDDISRFYILCIFVFGLVFSQMEEPGYMLFVTTFIAIQWQERQCQKYGYQEPATPRKLPKSVKGWVKSLLMIPGY